jgi:hypothetical protein
MNSRKHMELDQGTGMLDVQLLDVLAHIESLLGDAREIQRQLLRVRGVPEQVTQAQRTAAASLVRKTTHRMVSESRGLAKAVVTLQRSSETLEQLAKT